MGLCSSPIFKTLPMGVVPRIGPSVLDFWRGRSVSWIPTSRAREGLGVRPLSPKLWLVGCRFIDPHQDHPVQPWHPVFLRAPRPPPTVRHISSRALSHPQPLSRPTHAARRPSCICFLRCCPGSALPFRPRPRLPSPMGGAGHRALGSVLGVQVGCTRRFPCAATPQPRGMCDGAGGTARVMAGGGTVRLGDCQRLLLLLLPPARPPPRPPPRDPGPRRNRRNSRLHRRRPAPRP